MEQNNCRKTLKQTDCGNIMETQEKNIYAPFSVCLPFGRTLLYDGVGLRLKEQVTLPDGRYGVITVANGCIVDADEQPVCEFTPQPCAPAASPCGGTAGAELIPLQPGADNLLNYDALNRLGASLVYRGDGGISITGNGTHDSPLVISYDGGEEAKTFIQQGNLAVTVTGAGTMEDPYMITHREGKLTPGTYNGITVDGFGHVTNIETITGAVTEIISTTLDVESTGSLRKINLKTQTSDVPGAYQLGGYTLTHDATGILTSVTRTINLGEDPVEIDPAYVKLTVTPFGSIADIQPQTVTASDQFCEVFTDARDSTFVEFTTRKAAYFKVTYRGLLPVTAQSGSSTTNAKGLVPLTAPYSVRVGNRTIPAYAVVDTTAGGITEIIALSDALYAPGEYTVQVYNTTTSETAYKFSDIGYLTVELVGRGGE